MERDERTMIMIKPDAFKRRLVCKIISRFKKAGLKVVERKKINKPDRCLLELHYCAEEFARKGMMKIRKMIIDYYSIGPIMVILFGGENAVQRAREIVGSRNPRFSKKGTIRSWVDDSIEEADARREAMRDLIHAPRGKKEAKRQVKVWFGKRG